MKKILLVIAILTALLMVGCNKEEKIENNNLTDITNNEQAIINNDDVTEGENTFSLDEETANEYIKLIGKYVNEYPDSELKFELVYFDNNDIPDLVIDLGSDINLFEYENGEMKTIIEHYSYGVHGRWPSYYEKKGVLTDYATDGTESWSVEYYELVDGKLDLTYSRSGKIEGDLNLVENGKLITDIENDSYIRFLDDYNNCTLSSIIKKIDSSIKNGISKITISNIDNIIESRNYELKDLKFNFPFLNVESNDVAKINLKIRLKEIELLEMAKTYDEDDHWDLMISEVSYKYSYINNGNVLSLVVNYIDSDSHSITYNGADTFNIDINTGKLLKTSEIYSQNDLKEKIKESKNVKTYIENFTSPYEKADVYLPNDVDDVKLYVLNNEYHVIVEILGVPGPERGFFDITIE